MPKILVNYGRDDSAPYAGRLADRLREHFGRGNVFVDIDTIRPGEDFVERIDQSIAACDVLVAVIGRSWLTAADSQGRRRLDRDDDFVRMEIAKALEHHVRVIPALVGDASMPEPAQLPQNLVALSQDTPASGSSSGTPPATGSAVTPDPPPGGATATGSAADQPGAPLEAPPIAAAPTGKTGIQVLWRGTSSVPCYLFDETGTNALSPETRPPRGGAHPTCGHGTRRQTTGCLHGTVMRAKICTRDLGPGNYQVKVDAPGYQPVTISIAAFRITDLPLP